MSDKRKLEVDRLKNAFFNSPEYSVKWKNYFSIYSELFQKYVGTSVTFVEVGVLHGGSLFMWREYFGPDARIIGIDLNPEALKWERFGFEIYIGDQADANFWALLSEKVGETDILLDDGGHTNLQQIQTIRNSINFIADDGMIVIEDTHTSYLKDFGNPSSSSGVEFAKSLIDSIALRNPEILRKELPLTNRIHSIRFFESLFAIYFDKSNSSVNEQITNNARMDSASDFRYYNGSKIENSLRWIIKKLGYRKISNLTRFQFVNVILSSTQRIFYIFLKMYLKIELKRSIRPKN